MLCLSFGLGDQSAPDQLPRIASVQGYRVASLHHGFLLAIVTLKLGQSSVKLADGI